LEEHGIIVRGRGLSRSIELVDEKIDDLVAKRVLIRRPPARGRQRVLRIPMAGTPIAAGMPIPVLERLQTAEVEAHEMLEVDPRLLGRWAEGEAVAVWLKAEEETTLKRYYREGEGRVRLQPENPRMEPIITDEANIQIMGRLVSVLRCCD
jgi:repressor LexA